LVIEYNALERIQMELEIRTRERDGVTIVDVAGEMSRPYINVRSVITRSIEQGTKRLVLNLENATYIDSTWLGAIVFRLHETRPPWRAT